MGCARGEQLLMTDFFVAYPYLVHAGSVWFHILWDKMHSRMKIDVMFYVLLFFNRFGFCCWRSAHMPKATKETSTFGQDNITMEECTTLRADKAGNNSDMEQASCQVHGTLADHIYEEPDNNYQKLHFVQSKV